MVRYSGTKGLKARHLQWFGTQARHSSSFTLEARHLRWFGAQARPSFKQLARVRAKVKTPRLDDAPIGKLCKCPKHPMPHAPNVQHLAHSILLSSSSKSNFLCTNSVSPASTAAATNSNLCSHHLIGATRDLPMTKIQSALHRGPRNLKIQNRTKPLSASLTKTAKLYF